VVTGFYELAAHGVVRLRVTGELRGEASEWQDPLSLRAVVAGRRVIYDLSDGWYIPLEVRPYLELAEFYFKRALDPARLEGVPEDVMVAPLGLNYLVSSRRNLWHRGVRPFDARRLARGATRRLSGMTSRFGTRDVREVPTAALEAPPSPNAAPRILFMCRAWAGDPAESDYLRGDREAVNEMRAACIRTARKEFGSAFYGGFAHDEFTRRHYGDCLLPDAKAGERRAFLERVRSSAICVATAGLHDSIGWKMGEYVAASRAIVSERLRYLVPGGFGAERNLLEFESLDEFIAAVDELMGDAARRASMMEANRDYYRRWVRPEAQVMRTLEQILGAGKRPPATA
jgi:hypothetical protein